MGGAGAAGLSGKNVSSALGPVIGATGQDEKKEEHRQIEG